MCGLIGVLRYGELGDKDNRLSALYLATTLLELTEGRGKDATGIAALFDDGNVFGQKMAVRSSDFVARFGGDEGDFDGLQAILRDYDAASLRTIIGHCRKKSVGGAFENVNNHPIKVGNILGIHNGTLKNHEVIFENLKCGRDGTVDSEAIFRLLQYYTKNCKDPFTLEMLDEVTKRLEGSFSILAFNANNPSQVISARDGRPAEYCLIKPLKTILVASEEKILKAAIWEYNKLAWNHAVPGFTKLKESDIEIKALPDDTLALFDLTREITPETKIADLYDTQKVVRAFDRIWKVPTKTTTYNNGYQGNRQNGYKNASNTNNTASNTKDTKDTKSDDKKSDDKSKEDKKSETSDSNSTQKGSAQDSKKENIGMAWNANMEQYVTAWGKRENEKSVVLDTEKKQLMSLTKALESNTLDDKDSALEEDTNDSDSLNKKLGSVERYKKGLTVAITDITPIESEDTKPKITKLRKSADAKSTLAAIKAGVEKGKHEVSDEMQASKAAIAAAHDLKKYETAADVATLCNTDETSLEKLPIVTLTNRLLKQHFAKIFMAGYLTKCEATNEDNKPDRMSKAKKHIRILKGVTAVMDGVFSEDKNTSKAREHIEKLTKDGALGEITSGTLKEIFNSGDLRGNKSVRTLVSTLDNITTD